MASQFSMSWDTAAEALAAFDILNAQQKGIPPNVYLGDQELTYSELSTLAGKPPAIVLDTTYLTPPGTDPASETETEGT